MNPHKFLPLLAFLLAGSSLCAAVKGQTVAYKQGDAALEGFLAYDDAQEGKRPGVIVVPDWMGMSEHYNGIAKKLAGMGYIAFAADIYGKEVRPKTSKEAGAQSSKFKKDRKLMRARVNAALNELKKDARVDAKRIAAIGYCFGGTCILELARSGAEVAGVVSFHGGLATPTPEDAKSIKAKVLICHGADDRFVPAEEVAAFQDEMRSAKVDWQMIYYADSVHSFTKKSAGSDHSKGVAYNEKADRRSWVAMQCFFEEIFKAGKP